MIPVAIAGASGRMGRTLIEATLAAPDIRLSGAFDVRGSALAGMDAGRLLGTTTGVTVTDDLQQALAGARCFIDFTRPEGSLVHLAACRAAGVAIVIGTTGFDAAGKAAIAAAASDIPIVFASNMSVGVNVTFKLLELAASILDEGYDIEIIEAHHRHKVDAPSGTALGMGEAIAAVQNKNLDHDGVFVRHGVTGERPPGKIGFATIRGGDIVGDHTALFAGIGERIEITHRSSSRMTYALGSLRACRFLASRNDGLYNMRDVLGL